MTLRSLSTGDSVLVMQRHEFIFGSAPRANRDGRRHGRVNHGLMLILPEKERSAAMED